MTTNSNLSAVMSKDALRCQLLPLGLKRLRLHSNQLLTLHRPFILHLLLEEPEQHLVVAVLVTCFLEALVKQFIRLLQSLSED